MVDRLWRGIQSGFGAYVRVADVRGRSTRTEVLCFFGVALGLSLLTKVLAEVAGTDFLNPGSTHAVAMLAIEHMLLLPVFALSVRRLHDIGLPGWPAAINATLTISLGLWHNLSVLAPELAPLPGAWDIVRIVSLLLMYAALFWMPTRAPNRYGPDPRGIETA